MPTRFMFTIRHPLISWSMTIAVLGALAPVGWGDWRDEIGWEEFKEFSGPGYPDGSGVAVVQAESDSNGSDPGVLYLPDSEDPEMSGKTIVAQTDGGSNSNHALTVAQHFFGNATSLAAGVTDVDAYEADDYLDRLPGIAALRRVHCHAWISTFPTETAGERAAAVAELGAIDSAIASGGFLVVGGLNNGSGTSVPHVFGSTYNALSIGLSDGGHSSGGTTFSDYGSGRVKPELVLPHGTNPNDSFTSYSTGEACSVAAVLYEAAADGGHADAEANSEVMKAILMAGAVKEKFDAWDRTPTRPLDEVFGAGEAQILHSYRILMAGKQGPGAVSPAGWSYSFLRNAASSRSYTFNLAETAAEISLCLNWNYPGSGTLRDLRLRLERTDGGAVLYDESDSPVDNVEHIYYRNLPAGDYAITVERADAGTSRISFGLAWRTSFAPPSQTTIVVAAGEPVLTVTNVFKGKQLVISRSFDQVTWTPVHTVTPTTWQDYVWTDPSLEGGADRAFYRSSWENP